jgi:DNA-binding IclR family transcriptional regulator
MDESSLADRHAPLMPAELPQAEQPKAEPLRVEPPPHKAQPPEAEVARAEPAKTEVPKSVLARGLRLLDAFGTTDVELSLSQLAERTGLPKPTAYRLLHELVRWGGLERTERGYRLGMSLFMLGQRVPRQRELREAALPYLEDLYEATHENVHLAVFSDACTLFLEKVSGRDSMSIGSRVGIRMPAYCTATGKVFLAFGPPEYLRQVLAAGLVRHTPRTIVMPGLLQQELARTVQRGYGINHEEAEVGVSAVAAPVLNHQRRVVAAISITGYARGLDLERLAPAVRTASLGLSRDLSRNPATTRLSRPPKPRPQT